MPPIVNSTNVKPVTPLTLPQLALNLITVGTGHSFEDILDACVAVGIGIVSPWQDHYASIGVQHAARLLRDRSIRVNTVCRMSGFGSADSAQRWQEALGAAHQIIEEAAELQATSVTVIGGGLPAAGGGIDDTRRRIIEGIECVLPAARAAGVTLAIEPLHPMVAAERGAISTLAQASEIAARLGEGCAVMIDAYNTWWDPALAAAINSTDMKIGGYQVSDWLVPTTDLAFDRGMPGDGIIDLAGIRAIVQGAGYAGPIEVEVLSGRWSALAPADVLQTVVARFCRVC